MSSVTLSRTPSPCPSDDVTMNAISSTTSHLPGDHPETPTRPRAAPKTASWHSMEHAVQTPDAANSAMMEAVAKENNPRPLRQLMQDSADCWVRSTDDPFTMRFPAKIDRTGQFARLGPYFNLPTTGLDIIHLKKARAQFELKFLGDEDTDCPPEAIACSGTALEAMMILHNELEDSLKLNDTNYVNVTPFWRSYDASREDYFSAIVSTNALFQGLPATGKIVAPKLTRADFGKSGGSLSPSKAKAVASRVVATSSAVTAKTDNTGARVVRIPDLPDPQGRYAGLIRAHAELVDAKVVAPDILDMQGIRINPSAYDMKFQDGQYVEVEVLLKLWNIRGDASSISNGSRVYQLILKSMKLLPYRLYTKEAMLGTTKKRTMGSSFDDDDYQLEGQSPTKKMAIAGPRNNIQDRVEL